MLCLVGSRIVYGVSKGVKRGSEALILLNDASNDNQISQKQIGLLVRTMPQRNKGCDENESTTQSRIAGYWVCNLVSRLTAIWK